jgi:hypothetical protein
MYRPGTLGINKGKLRKKKNEFGEKHLKLLYTTR